MKRLLFVVLLLAGALAAPVSPAEAAACSGSSGVTVLVQFPDHTEIGCAAGDPASGYQALSWAGFQVTLATGNGTGAICSINHYPDHDCTSMPPQSAYWAYFHATPGGSWSYSNTGGGSYNPKPGTVEGWRFGSGSAPSTAPPGSASTPKPSPTPTRHPTSVASNPVVKPASSSRPSSGSTPMAPDVTPTSITGSGSPTAQKTTGSTASATATDVEAPESAATGATSTKGAQDTSDDQSSGSRSWIWGVVLVGVLGAAAGTTAVRRRRS